MGWIGLLVLATAPQVEHFLDRDEAIKIAIPDADRVCTARIRLSAAERRAVRAALRRPVPEAWTFYIGVRDGEIVGYAAVTDVVGKYQPITFIVGVTPEAKVRDVAVMTYRESIGGDVRGRRFLDQLAGRSTRSALKCKGARRDLRTISGATMSCEAVALGTKMVLHVADQAFIRNPARARAIVQEPVAQSRLRMGSLLKITVYGDGAREAVGAAFEEVARIDRLISNYDPDSELSKLNAAAGKGPQKVGEELTEFLKLCRRWSDATGGAFDPTVGPAVRAWGFFDKKYRVPSDAELKRLKERVGSDRWSVEPSVELKVAGMELDPGAIGKGYAVDRAVAVLKERGIESALVDFGSVQFALGAPPGKKGWSVAIRDPLKPKRMLTTRVLKDAALSTSGGNEKFFERDGKRYSHILDPRTLKPAEGTALVCVVGGEATSADALSTALFVLGAEGAGRLKAKALIVAADGKQTKTGGW